ncbi:MAG TPA: DUF1269 domain-containing protein [Chloroflexia bacterium]|nr:DUF1269 domain-containing protein [Chloroflexia bacterium]
MDSNAERDGAATPEPEAEGATYPAADIDHVAAELEAAAAASPEDDTVIELLVASFADDERAEAAYNTLRDVEKQGQLLTADLAIVERHENNHLSVREAQDVDAAPGALLGAGIGAILGTVAGPLGLVAGAAGGAFAGGVAAESIDAGVEDDWLRALGEALKPGSALVAVAIARYWVPLAAGYLQQAGGEVTRHPLPEPLASELQSP